MRSPLPLALLLAAALAACAPPAAAPVPLAAGDFAAGLGIDPAAMERTSSGVLYRDVVAGAGPVARTGRRVAVHYVGWLPDGTQIDARVAPAEPMEFRLGTGEVIRGWDDGIQGMRPGGQRQLVVPPHLGYGGRAQEGVPRHSTLVFLVELVGVG